MRAKHNRKVDMSAEKFGDYLKSDRSEVWKMIEWAGLESAPVWGWTREKYSVIEFSSGDGYSFGPAWLEAWDTERKRQLPEAWFGLGSENFPELPFTDGEKALGPCAVRAGELGVDLNRAIAAWMGRAYTPQPGSRDAEVLCGIETAEAALSGDIERLESALNRYGIGHHCEHERALHYAAYGGHVEFVRTLIKKTGTYIASGLFLDSEESAMNASAELRGATATIIEAGVPYPDYYKGVIRIWAKTDPRFTVFLL